MANRHKSEFLANMSHELRIDRLVEVIRRHRPERPILVVDDEAEQRALLRRILEREGYAVMEAENGRVALARLRERAAGLILLDLMMPEMDGSSW